MFTKLTCALLSALAHADDPVLASSQSYLGTNAGIMHEGNQTYAGTGTQHYQVVTDGDKSISINNRVSMTMPLGFDTSDTALAQIYSCASRNADNALQTTTVSWYICYFWSYEQVPRADSTDFDGNIWLNVFELTQAQFTANVNSDQLSNPSETLNAVVPATCTVTITVRNGVVTTASLAGCSAYSIVADNIKVGANSGKMFQAQLAFSAAFNKAATCAAEVMQVKLGMQRLFTGMWAKFGTPQVEMWNSNWSGLNEVADDASSDSSGANSIGAAALFAASMAIAIVN